MRLELEGFKLYDTPSEHVFPEEGTCLIQGASGRGKSTLFAATAWALYGKEKDPYSWNGKRKVCRVRLELPDKVVVVRQKNPERLQVTTPEGRVLDSKDEAQAYLGQRYGTAEVWTAACYLRQDRHNPLMEGKAGDIVSLLETMAFHDDVPSVYLAEANKRRQEARRALDQAQAVVDHVAEPVPRGPLNALTHPATKEHYNDTVAAEVRRRQAAARLDPERRLLERDLADQDAILASVPPSENTSRMRLCLRLLEQYEGLYAEYEALAPLPPSVGEDLEGALKDALRQSSVATVADTYGLPVDRAAFEAHVKDVEQTLSVVEEVKQRAAFAQRPVAPPTPLDPSLPAYSDAHVRAAREQAKAHAAWSKALTQAAMDVDTAKVFVDMEPYVKRWKAYNDAGEHYEAHMAQRPEGVVGDDLEAEGTAKLVELEKLRLGLEAHTCPTCKTALRLRDTGLELAKACPSTFAQVRVVEKQVAWLTKARRLDEDLAHAEQAMEDCPYDEDALVAWTPARLERATQLLALKPVDPPVPTADQMEAHTRWVEWHVQDQRWKAWEAHVPAPVRALAQHARADLVRRLSDLSQVLAQWPSRKVDVSPDLLMNHLRLVKRMETLEEQLAGGEWGTSKDLEAALAKADERDARRRAAEARRAVCLQRLAELPPAVEGGGEDLDTYAEELTWMPRFLADQGAYEAARAVLAQRTAEHTLAARLVETLKALEHRVLYGYLETLNSTIASVLTEIFDDPITVRLDLMTQDKPDAKWLITYKGGKDTALHELSGGEQARVSFAVTLALASVHPFPVLLLDECFGALDEETRLHCLDAMRAVLHKPVLVIAHGETEGFYDDVKDL
jgi:AAA domain